jgi:hypothetical protein
LKPFLRLPCNMTTGRLVATHTCNTVISPIPCVLVLKDRLPRWSFPCTLNQQSEPVDSLWPGSSFRPYSHATPKRFEAAASSALTAGHVCLIAARWVNMELLAYSGLVLRRYNRRNNGCHVASAPYKYLSTLVLNVSHRKFCH